MNRKSITIVFFRRNFPRRDWEIDFPAAETRSFLEDLTAELAPLGVDLHWKEEEQTIEVKGYQDLLNSVRIRSPFDGLGNPCLGHIIGPSPDRRPLEDLRRGITRVAFAPETIEPEGSSKVVCHNCGCGC